ncbi:MAG: hypothetical protein V7L11_06435 [Nostoc sp.]|uniref:hypothetical protein n=1 Tax=Nostoc sp. TaxID=1180 RepID=UPI002FF8120C
MVRYTHVFTPYESGDRTGVGIIFVVTVIFSRVKFLTANSTPPNERSYSFRPTLSTLTSVAEASDFLSN